jgi:DNA-binding IclR family transcriptional regulator
MSMAEWSFLTNHARVLVCIAHDPGVRLRDIANTLDITERSAYSIVTDLTASGYVVKQKDGRWRSRRYRLRANGESLLSWYTRRVCRCSRSLAVLTTRPRQRYRQDRSM